MTKTIYLTDSKEWYKDDEQAQAYLDIMTTSYSGGIVAGEDALLAELHPNLEQAFGQGRTYVDLGPGDGRKTDAITSRLVGSGVLKNYVGVDIQPMYTKIAENIVSSKGVPTQSYVGSFEDFLQENRSDGSNFVYLGATYGNFDTDFDKLLSKSMHQEDVAYLSCALFPQNLETVVEGYKSAMNMFAPIAKRNGISTANPSVQFNSENNQIELGFIEGDACYVLGISKKPTEEQFKERVLQHFDGSFYSNDAHIGFLGKPRK